MQSSAALRCTANTPYSQRHTAQSSCSPQSARRHGRPQTGCRRWRRTGRCCPQWTPAPRQRWSLRNRGEGWEGEQGRVGVHGAGMQQPLAHPCKNSNARRALHARTSQTHPPRWSRSHQSHTRHPQTHGHPTRQPPLTRGRHNGHVAAGHALADVVVGLAHQAHHHAVDQEAGKGLARRAAQVELQREGRRGGGV